MSKATSIAAYRILSQSDHFSEIQSLVLEAITKHGPLTRKELAVAINRPINSLADATLRLVEAGTLIEVKGMNLDTGRKAMKLMLPGKSKNIPQKLPSKSKSIPKAVDPITTTPTTKEQLAASILMAKFTKDNSTYVTQVEVNGIIYLVEVTPQARKGN